MSTWLQRIKKMLATPPKGGAPDSTETEFQQRARELLQSESGAQTLKDVLLAHKPELGRSSMERRKLWQRQLDHVQGVLHAFAAERAVERAKSARADARAEQTSHERAARGRLTELQDQAPRVAAELKQLQTRLATLDRVAAETEQALRADHEQRVTNMRTRLAEAVAADDAVLADGVSAELSAELRQEAERREADARAPQPAALQAGVLRTACQSKAAELEQLQQGVRQAEADLARCRLTLAAIDYHESVAGCMLAAAQAAAEGARYRHDESLLQLSYPARLERLELDLAVSWSDLVPMGDKLVAFNPNNNRWSVQGRFIQSYLMPLFTTQLDLEVFKLDTTRPWPDEATFEREVQADLEAEASHRARMESDPPLRVGHPAGWRAEAATS